jgi:F0F1-type ATP synthase assembly protein I
VGLVNLNGKNDGGKYGWLKTAGPYTGLGLELATTILVFLFIGRWLDHRWDTTPWLMIAGAALGFAAGFYGMFRTLAGLSKPGERNRKDK